MTASIGVFAGLGSLGVALLGMLIILITLALVGPFEVISQKKIR